MKDRAVIIITACFIRLSTNLIWPFWGGATFYYVGQALFEAMILWVLLSFSQGHLKTTLSFFFGLSCYALIKEVFLTPTKLELPEYFGVLVGAAFLIYSLYKNDRTKRVN